MSARSRRAFVAVVTASAASIVTATASANPPAPSSLPDPLKLGTLKTGETPHRIRRHDGGCYVYGDEGPVGKLDCPKDLDQPTEEIEREPESGQCVLIEPWAGEPREVDCPSPLVPAGWVPPRAKPASLAVSADPPKPSPSSPTSSKSGCTGCEVGAQGSSSTMVPLLGAAAAVAIATRRRRR